MGQQQLLLLVLGIVVVGLAVTSGIQAFGEMQRRAVADQHTQEAVAMAAELIAWWKKPVAMGGGGRTADFSSLTLEDLGYPVTQAVGSRTTYDVNGYRRSLYRDDSAMPRIHLHPNPWRQVGNTNVEVGVWGPDPACIVHRVGRYSTATNGWNYNGQTLANPDPSLCSW
ncbi:MAG: hypothetical protein AAF809_10765 [Bacteroidota bacterium]